MTWAAKLFSVGHQVETIGEHAPGYSFSWNILNIKNVTNQSMPHEKIEICLYLSYLELQQAMSQLQSQKRPNFLTLCITEKIILDITKPIVNRNSHSLHMHAHTYT